MLQEGLEAACLYNCPQHIDLQKHEKKHWTCPNCGMPFSVHDRNCPHCGRRID